MKTYEEIIARINERQSRDIFGFEASDLMGYLPWDRVKQFLKPNAQESDWKPLPRDKDAVTAQILAYMPFAWEKANNCRGLSASRSLSHMAAWLWMIEVDIPLENYTHYGKPQLRAICEHFKWDWRQWDDGHWMNSEFGPSVKPEDVS